MNDERHPDAERLSAYLEHDLPGDEREAVSGHLEGCDRCRTVLDDLRSVVRRAGELDDRPPASDLWPGIARAIEEEEEAGGRGEGLDIRRPGGLRDRWVRMSVAQLAAAAAGLMILSGGLAWLAHPGGVPAAAVGPEASPALLASNGDPGAEGAPEGYVDEVAELQRILRESRDRLDPATVRVLQKNLDVIDRAIRESRAALEVDPGNAFLERHLERTYRKKLEYLRDAARVAEWSS